MSNRGDILYSQARRVMNHRHSTPPGTNMEPCQELMDETGDHSHLLLEKSEHMHPLKSRVVCENFSNKPLEIKELSIDGFWDFLYSREWEGGNSVRVLDGQLLSQLSHSIVFLRNRGKVVAHTTFAYAKHICPETWSCHKQADKETINSVEETLLIELTNLGRLTKPLPNRPMDDPVHVMSVYESPRKEKTKPKPQIMNDAKRESDNTSLHVPHPTKQRKAKSQIMVHSLGENNSDLSVLTKQESQDESFLLPPPKYLELQRTDNSRKSKSSHASTQRKMSPSNSATQERSPDGNAVRLPLLGKRKCDDWAISQSEYMEESTKPIKTHTKKLLLYQDNLEKCPDKNVVKLPRLVEQRNNDWATCLAERSEYSIKSTKSPDANESENPIKNQLQKNEKATVEFGQQKSIDDLDEALYLGNEVVPPEAYEIETTVMKLKIRKQELQKERELKKLLMKQSTEIKPFLPKLKPLDSENISLQLVHYPILNFEVVPTLEEMIKFMRDDEHTDPRYRVDLGKYKKRKIIRKYNLSRETIMHVLKGIHRRHAVTLHSDRFGTIEEFVKRFSTVLQNYGDTNTNDEAHNKHASLMQKWLAGAEVGKEAEGKSKCKWRSVVGAIRDSSSCKNHVRLHTMADQSKSLLDVQPKTRIAPLEHGLTQEGSKHMSIAPEETSSIQNVSKTAPLTPVKNATLAPLECDSGLDSTKQVYNFSTECIPNPDILVTTSTGEIFMTMKTSRPLSVSSRQGIKYVRSRESADFNTLRNASETLNGEGQFPKICMHDDNSDEPSIPKSSDESDSEQEQLLMEVPNLNTFDTDNLNALDSLQKVPIKKRMQKGIPSFMDIVKKYSRMQEILQKFSKVQPRMEDRMTKEKVKQAKVPGTQQNETNRLNMQNVLGTLRAFNFLSKSPIQKQTSRSTPSKLHFPTSYTTEKFMLKFSQALEDFVVRREIVISNRDWKCSNSVTFTRKTVFTLRRM